MLRGDTFNPTLVEEGKNPPKNKISGKREEGKIEGVTGGRQRTRTEGRDEREEREREERRKGGKRRGEEKIRI